MPQIDVQINIGSVPLSSKNPVFLPQNYHCTTYFNANLKNRTGSLRHHDLQQDKAMQWISYSSFKLNSIPFISSLSNLIHHRIKHNRSFKIIWTMILAAFLFWGENVLISLKHWLEIYFWRKTNHIEIDLTIEK